MGYYRKKKGETPKSPPGWCTVSDQLISRSTSKAPRGHNNKRYKKVNPSGSNIFQTLSNPIKIILIHPYPPTGFGHQGEE